MSEKKKMPQAATDAIKRVRDKMSITKVVCTRSIKGRFGDSYVGFSASWDTVQDDAGGGGDLVGDDGASFGMTLKEAKLAGYIVAMQADIAAHEHAVAGGNMTSEQADQHIRVIKHNYSILMADLYGGLED